MSKEPEGINLLIILACMCIVYASVRVGSIYPIYVFLIPYSVGVIALCVGLLLWRAWAWWLSVFIIFVSLVAHLIDLFANPPKDVYFYTVIFLKLVAVIWMLMPSIRAAFRSELEENES